jgi:hypothetical protein
MATEIITRKDARAQGLRRYFTGKPCKRGHVSERNVRSLTCMECDRVAQAVRLPKRDREKERQRLRLWRASNREKVNAKSRAANATPERKAYKAAWFQENKEHVLEQRRTNPNSSKSNVASAARWAKENPEKAREYSRMNRRKRRAQMKGSGGTHTASDLAAILKAQGHRCAYVPILKKHVDHRWIERPNEPSIPLRAM